MAPPPSPPPSPNGANVPQLLGRLQLSRQNASHAAYHAYETERDRSRPARPEHIQMVNNLLAEKRAVVTPAERDRQQRFNATLQLPCHATPYNKLHRHMKTIAQTPTQVCFNCALLMHPHSDNVLKLPLAATPIRTPADCRGYRVAKHYIDELVTRVVGDGGSDGGGGGDNGGDGDGSDDERATRDSVFRCCTSADGLHVEVFSCAACKHERAQQPSHNLFDGVAADGSYTSCGVGDPQPAALAALTVYERLTLSVLQMADASFSAYAGYGYMHYNGGAILTANDYTGNAALLMRNPHGDGTDASRGRLPVDERRLRAALDHLGDPNHGNPLVRSLLTCLERELPTPSDVASASASDTASGMPMLSEADANANDESQPATDEPQAPVPVADVTLAPVARQLNQQTFGGVFQGVDDVDAASVAQRNGVHRQMLGSTRARGAQASTSAPVISRDVAASTDALLHTTLYPTGRGGHVRGDDVCNEDHYRRIRLGGVAPKFRHAEEFLWSTYQSMVKKCFHRGGPRMVNADVAAAGISRESVRAHEAMHAANPEMRKHLTPEESFSGGVPKTMVGSKGYWKNAFVELMAMACEYGIPPFFATFTANEGGWADCTSACEGEYYTRRPVEATRQYAHRWSAFKSNFLTGNTPIGKIAHTWHRQEDQARASLHVHMAIWTDGPPKPEAICGMAPRGPDPTDPEAGLTPAELAWRKFVLNVQRHDCYPPKCYFKKGESTNGVCKYLYPRHILDRTDEDGAPVMYEKNSETDRFDYRTTKEEDQRLSPYIPLWLLATGASMNIQYCTTAGFLSYISKYVTKTEPHGVVGDSAALRRRQGLDSERMRYLTARIVGAPEAVFRMFGYSMKVGCGVTHLCTKPPGQRKRALARVLHDDDAGSAGMRFWDGTLEQYARRPLSQADGPDFSNMLYKEFHRDYEVVSRREQRGRATQQDSWPCCTLPHELGDEALETYAHSRCVVRRARPRPVWYDWLVPSKHKELYYYQQLLLKTTWRDATPEALIASYDANPTGSLRAECELRGIIPTGEQALREVIASEAEARHFAPDAVQRLLDAELHADDLEQLMNAMMGADADADDGDARSAAARQRQQGDDDAAMPDVNDDDSTVRLQDEIAIARREQPPPPPPPPPVAPCASGALYAGTAQPVMLWLEPGCATPWRLTHGQWKAFDTLKQAGAKQIMSFLSGEGGVGKSTLVRLLVQQWRSDGYSVIVMASSAKAARLIDGHTVHSACGLDPTTGRFEQSRIEGSQGQDRFVWLAKADIVVIDEISMLTTSALHGVNSALNYVMTTGVGACRRDMTFGEKSVVAVGDLYQLPAVERGGREQQVYQSVMWPRFRLLELTELVRIDPTQQRVKELLSRVRTAWTGTMHDGTPHADFRDDDHALLASRLCSQHCPADALHHFNDVQRLRPERGGATRRDETDVPQAVCHCPVSTGATVLAARCKKVDALNSHLNRLRGRCASSASAANTSAANTSAAHADADAVAAASSAAAAAALASATAAIAAATGRAPTFDATFTCDAVDTWVQNGRVVTQEVLRSRADANLSGHPRRLEVRVGQCVLLTMNRRRQHADYANGTLCTVVDIMPGGDGNAGVVHVRPTDWPISDRQRPIAIRRQTAVCRVDGRELQRNQFPIIPAAAMTVHRVQGMTLEGDVHVLLNGEFFADGQAYVALSRVRRLEQLHFWALDLARIKAAPGVAGAYASLRRRPLTLEYVSEHTMVRQRMRHDRLLPLAGGPRPVG